MSLAPEVIMLIKCEYKFVYETTLMTKYPIHTEAIVRIRSVYRRIIYKNKKRIFVSGHRSLEALMFTIIHTVDSENCIHQKKDIFKL